MRFFFALLIISFGIPALAGLPFPLDEQVTVTVTKYDSGNYRGGFTSEENKLYLRVDLTSAQTLKSFGQGEGVTIREFPSQVVPYFKAKKVEDIRIITGREFNDAVADFIERGEGLTYGYRLLYSPPYVLELTLCERSFPFDECIVSKNLDNVDINQLSESPSHIDVIDDRTGAGFSVFLKREASSKN